MSGEGKIVLNTQTVAGEEAGNSSDAENTVRRLRVAITSLKGSHMSEDGSSVAYTEMASSPQFEEYVRTAALLRHLSPETFSEEQRKAFFVNIYNCLTVHAMVHQAGLGGMIPSSPKDVPGFWEIHCYDIGGLVYNLDEMEHGVLRSNKGHPFTGLAKFPASDPRSRVSLTKLDPRIHFALNCGARSCPPIRVYTQEKLGSQLQIATKAFLSQEVNLLQDKTETGQDIVQMSKLFLWYGKDFGDTPSDILGWVVGMLGDQAGNLRAVLVKGEFELSFKDYDWTANRS